MELYRTALTKGRGILSRRAFRDATGASFYAQQYKRDKNPALTGQIKTYYNAKSLYYYGPKSDVPPWRTRDFLRDVRAAIPRYSDVSDLKDIADA
jgi:hypothetical protein